MFVPAVVALVVSWRAVIHGESVLAVEHAAMLPAISARTRVRAMARIARAPSRLGGATEWRRRP